MNQPNKQSNGTMDAALVVASLVLFVILFGGAAVTVLALRLTGMAPDGLAAWVHDPQWSTRTTVAEAAMLLPGLVVLLLGLGAFLRGRRNRVWTDDKAGYMSSARDTAEMTRDAVEKDSARLGYGDLGPGVVLGRGVRDRCDLYSTFEWSQLWIMGTRAGKSRRVAVRQIAQHHGPVVSTSNKRDVHDKTRGLRDELGRVWVNDPQDIIGEPPSWWWNPVSCVTNMQQAQALIGLWAASRTASQVANLDPYFDPEGRKFAANMLMAAALGGELITRMEDWLTGHEPEPGVPDPTVLLRAHGFTSAANQIRAVWSMTAKQRDGITGTAQSFFGFMGNPRYARWIAPLGPDDTRPQFSPDQFVASRADTMYLVSQNGEGSARAITGALVMAIETAGERLARRSGGRVPRPVLFVLDEAANICRWPELPNLYSYCGGMGMVLVTILQSVSQGRGAWGEDGWKTMWSSTNVLAVGRGVNDVADLHDLAALIGDYEDHHVSKSSGNHGQRSQSQDTRDKQIFTVADLRAFPTGRAVLMASGSRPVLLETIDYSADAWAGKADASEHYYSTRTTKELAALMPTPNQTDPAQNDPAQPDPALAGASAAPSEGNM